MPTPIVHQTIAAARAYYALRRVGVPRDVSYAKSQWIGHWAYWEAQ